MIRINLLPREERRRKVQVKVPQATIVVLAGTGSLTTTLLAVTPPAALATCRQYSITAPGIAFGSVVPLNGSLITVAVLVTVITAVCTR